MMYESFLTVAPDHPAFAGHFPGQPILPGVVLLGWATHALAVALGGTVSPCDIVAAKFLQPVRPGTRLCLRHTQQAGTTWRFDFLAGDVPVATGTLRVPLP